MAIERNIVGWQMGDIGEGRYSGMAFWTGATVQTSGGRPGSGPFRLQLVTSTGAANIYTQPARAITGTTGTVTSGNHKRVRSRIYVRIDSVTFPFGNSMIRLLGCGGELTATGVSVWMDANRQLAIIVGGSAPANSGSGFSGSHTAALAVGTIYRLILDVDLDVQATTVVTASVQATTDVDSPPLDNTVSTSANIGASDALGKMSLLSEAIHGAFDTFGTFSFFDWVYAAASDADAVSALTLPTETHIFAIVPPTGTVLNQWSGSYVDVDEYPVDAVAAMSSSLGSGTEVEFSHASGIVLGLGRVAATKLYVNARVVSGTGNVDMMLNGVATTVLVASSYPDSSGASDPVGGLLWSVLTPQQFSAITFGVKKQNGTQQTFIGNIGLEVLGSAAAYGTGHQIRGETQIKTGTVFDAQLSDAANIQRHKIQGLQGAPIFFVEESQDETLVIPGQVGATGARGVAGPPGMEGSSGAEEMPWIPGPAGPTGATGAAGSGGGGGCSTSAFGSRPAPATDGLLFLPSDGFQIERDTSLAWVPWGPLFPLSAPSDTGFAWVNQGSSSLATTKDALQLLGAGTSNATSSNLVARAKTPPATPYTVTAYLVPPPMNKNNHGYGIGFRQAGAGTGQNRLVIMRYDFAGNALSVDKWTTTGAFSATYVSFTSRPVNWLRITNDGTNLIFYVSSDGQNWLQLHSVSKTDFLLQGPDQVLFYVNTHNAATPNTDVPLTVLSWKES